MLSWLDIRDFVIVKQVTLSFENGLTVITGETGAGKSIIVDALALLLGDRAGSSVIRPGATRTEIQACFDIPDTHPAFRWLKEQELLTEPEHDFSLCECILRRLIHADKAGRAFINGRPVTLHQLRQMGEFLMDIHSQNEHQSLLQKSVQRNIVDAYAGCQDKVARLTTLFNQINTLEDSISTHQQQSELQHQRLALLRFQINELETLAPDATEHLSLEETQKQLTHARELIDGVSQIVDALYDADQDSVSERLQHSIKTLETLTVHDSSLSPSLQTLREAAAQIDDSAVQLRQRRDYYELDPAELERINQRLFSYHEIARKHDIAPDQLNDILTSLSDELEQIENGPETIEKLRIQLNKLTNDYLKLGRQVSRLRKKAANELAEKITEQMHQLGMQQGSFHIHLDEYSKDAYTTHGLENIEFHVSANTGQPLTLLNKTASGGELSRISLAIQVVCVGNQSQITQIFDEVDVGIGGAIAEVVGRKLQSLSESMQILCITHLPQVAALGQNHLRVNKNASTSGSVSIENVGQRDRVDEIARMLGGVKITKRTLAHAREMLELTG